MKNLRKIEISDGIFGVKARYKKQILYDYKNNPLIEALPEIRDRVEIIDLLSHYPHYDVNEQHLDSELRCHLTHRLYQYFQPLDRHIELYNKIDLMIRQGYINRNPISKEFANIFNKGYSSILENNIDLNKNVNMKTTAMGLTLFGTSGAGKTTSINKILSNYSQVIVHSKYKRKSLTMYQIVWLKVEMPHDGSLKSFCLSVFRQIDELVGTDYFKKYGSGYIAANVMLTVIVQVFRNLNTGVLVIDELQNLQVAKNGGYAKVLNFFLMMVNTINIPIILVGTPSAINMLQNEFRIARRNSSLGSLLWDRLENDDNFELLLFGLWQYQWTRIKVQLRDEIKDLIYEESQGIIDVVVKIFVMSQQKAIRDGTEEITNNIIKSVVEEELKLIKPMINALKTNNVTELSKYNDIQMPYSNKSNNSCSTVIKNNEVADKPKTVKKKRESVSNYSEDDVRFIAQQAKSENISVYQNFKNHKIIKECLDFEEQVI